MSTLYTCSISGEPAEVPVVSPISGRIFEKRLIVKYINENDTDPFKNETLTVDQVGHMHVLNNFFFYWKICSFENVVKKLIVFFFLRYLIFLQLIFALQLIEIKTDVASAMPRTIAATSIPSMLKVLQDEWDACMLNSFMLREQLQNARQELSHTLYQVNASFHVESSLVSKYLAIKF